MRISVTACLLAFACAATSAHAQSPLTTVFAANTAGGPNWGIYFDIVSNGGVDITQLDLNVNAGIGTAGTLDVYVGPAGSTYLGNEANGLGAAPWPATPTATASFTAQGLNNPTPAVLGTPINLPPGTYAFLLVYSLPPALSNGSNSYSNNELTLNTGSATTQPAAGIVFSDRTWNGAVHYNTLSGFATATTYGNGCGSTPPPVAYELFTAANNPNDLPNSGFSLIWTGAPSYTLTTNNGTIVPPSGQPEAFADDEVRMFTLPFAMPTEAGAVTDIWIGSNGFIGFASITATGAVESIPDFLSGAPRIAVYWDDLDPSAATGLGTMHVEPDPLAPNTVFHITWTNVTQFVATAGGGSGTADSNTFQCTLNATGTIECKYGAMGSLDGLVGYSPGNGLADPGSMDISALAAANTSLDVGAPNMTLVPNTRPTLGTNAVVTLNDIPGLALGSPGAFLIGSQAFNPGIALDIVGMPGCELLSNARLTNLGFAVTGATEMLSLPINGALQGVHLYVQAAVIAPGFNALSAVTSDGVDWLIDTF